MYCHHCGQVIPDDSVYCHKCGKSQKTEAMGSRKAMPPEISPQPERRSSQGKRYSSLKIALVTCLAVVVALVIWYVASQYFNAPNSLRYDKENRNPSVSASTATTTSPRQEATSSSELTPSATPRSAATMPPTNSTSTPQSVPTATPAQGEITLIPVAIDSTEPIDGWKYYSVQFALANDSSQWVSLRFKTGNGTVETQEGYTYEADPVGYANSIPFLLGEPLAIPPGFRIIGSTDDITGFNNAIGVNFHAAEAAHPIRIRYQNGVVIDLQTMQRPNFPVQMPPSSFLSLGSTVKIPGKANITFQRAYRSMYGIYDGMTVDLEIQSLDPGYDVEINAACFVIDGLGYIRWNKVQTRFSVGPGQTSNSTLGFYLWNPQEAYYGRVAPDDTALNALKNAKLICIGDFQAVVNLEQ